MTTQNTYDDEMAFIDYIRKGSLNIMTLSDSKNLWIDACRYKESQYSKMKEHCIQLVEDNMKLNRELNYLKIKLELTHE